MMTQTLSNDTGTSTTLPISLSFISPHDDSVLAEFGDDGDFNTLLTSRLHPSTTLAAWIPAVFETEDVPFTNWLNWLAEMQRLTTILAQQGTAQSFTIPQSELTREDSLASPSSTITTGEDGVVMVTFSKVVVPSDPGRTVLAARLAELTAFVAQGQATGGSLLRNNLIAPASSLAPPDASPTGNQEP